MQRLRRAFTTSIFDAALWTIVAARYALLLPKLPARATRYDFSIY